MREEWLMIRYPGADQAEYYGLVKSRSDHMIHLRGFEDEATYSYSLQPTSPSEFLFALEQEWTKCSTDKAEYLEIQQAYLNLLSTGTMQKIIQSRIISKRTAKTDIQDWFDALCKKHPRAFVFAINTLALGTWIGATPELLAERLDKNTYQSMSLAGTKSADSPRAWTTKEITEQSIVTRHIQELCERHDWPITCSAPYDREAGQAVHRCTDILISAPGSSLLQVADALHPTPAICGVPVSLAQEMIAKMESHRRQLYCGYMALEGPCSAKAYVLLRCARVKRGGVDIFVGGGITAESDPESEWRETQLKASTILDVIS